MVRPTLKNVKSLSNCNKKESTLFNNFLDD